MGDCVVVGGVGAEYNWYNINFDEMKTITTLTIVLCSIVTWGQTKDTTRYHFTEPDAILIDNLIGQLDQVSGNSDRVSTSQYNQLHRAVLRVDSLIKVQYSKYHPVKEQPKKK